MTSFGSDRDIHGPSSIVESDVGIEASERLKSRRTAMQKTVRAFKITLVTASVLLIVILAGAGYWVYQTRVSGYVTDERSCFLEIGKSTLTGTRSYSYHFDEYLGYRITDTRAIDVTTKIQVKGNAFTVVNLRSGDSDVTRVGPGEQGIQILKPAERYVFMLENGSVGVVDSGKLCK